MTGWTRLLYRVIGMEYPEQADENQKRLKYLMCEQIKKSKLKLRSVEEHKKKKKKRKR